MEKNTKLQELLDYIKENELVLDDEMCQEFYDKLNYIRKNGK